MKLSAALVMGTCFTASAWASHDYHIEISVSALPDNHTIAILPPKGKAPNSVCMQTWQVPYETVEIANIYSYADHYPLTITDKNSGSCGGADKYNTWNFEIRKYDTQPSYRQAGPYKVVGTGMFQFFHHQLDDNNYETQIYARNTDGAPPEHLYVSQAFCTGKGQDKTTKTRNCLNTYVQGKYAADDISIYIKYPGGDSGNAAKTK